MEYLLYSHVHLGHVIKRVIVYINIYSFNQTIASLIHLCHLYTECLVMEIWFNVLETHIDLCVNPVYRHLPTRLQYMQCIYTHTHTHTHILYMYTVLGC